MTNNKFNFKSSFKMAHRIQSMQRWANHQMNSHDGPVRIGNLTEQQIQKLKIEIMNLKAHRQFIENSNMSLKKELSLIQQENNCLKCNIDVRVVHDALRDEIRLLNERVRSIDHENYLLNHKANDQLTQITNLTRELNILRALVPKEENEENEIVVLYTELDRKLEAVINENTGLKKSNRALVERIQKLLAEKNAMNATNATNATNNYYSDYM